MEVLTREQILTAAAECPSEELKVPSLGGTVIIKGLTAKELDAFEKSLTKKESESGDLEVDDDDMAVKLVTRCLVDGTGKRILKDSEYKIVQGWSGIVYRPMATAALSVNGYTDAAKNSPETAAGASSSG